MPAAAERTPGSRSVRTTNPFGAVVLNKSSSSRAVSTKSLVSRQQRLPGELHSAAVIHLQQLHLNDVALLDDILGLLGAAVLQLADVKQALNSGQDLDERAERGRALDRAL